jgi:senataxin
MHALLQFEEGVTPTAYAFALMEQRGDRDAISLRTFVQGEINFFNVAQPVTSPRLQCIASVFGITESFLWILKVSSVVLRKNLDFLPYIFLEFKDMLPQPHC